MKSADSRSLDIANSKRTVINRFVSDKFIVKEEVMKKVKVLDYHNHSDSSPIYLANAI